MTEKKRSAYPPPLPLKWDREKGQMLDATGDPIETLDWEDGQEHEFMERIAAALNAQPHVVRTGPTCGAGGRCIRPPGHVIPTHRDANGVGWIDEATP